MLPTPTPDSIPCYGFEATVQLLAINDGELRLVLKQSHHVYALDQANDVAKTCGFAWTSPTEPHFELSTPVACHLASAITINADIPPSVGI
jgi:hypothetical protein